MSVLIKGELDWEATKRFYREMLYIFEKILLPTHACSHTQFIMFYIVSLRTVSTYCYLALNDILALTIAGYFQVHCTL